MRPSLPFALRRAVSAVAVLATAAVIALPGQPAAAGAPQPSTPAFGRAIDAYAGYDGAKVCDPTEKPGAQALRSLIKATYGDTWFNITRSCGTSGTSEHHEGRAVDWSLDAGDPADLATAQAFITWLLATDSYGNRHAMARRLGIMYIIWNKQMWRAYDSDPAKPWRAYTGSSPHTDHVHISLSWDGAYKRTTWYTGATDCAQPAASTTPPPAVPSAGVGYLPVAPSRLLDTRSGTGLSTACTLGAGKRIDLQVAGRGGIPSSGVAAVALTVTVVKPAGPTYLSAYPSGVTWPGTSSVNADGGATVAATTVVRLGADGKVSLRNGPNRADVVVDVVGYHPTSGGSSFQATAPTRVLDTREADGAFAAGERRSVPLAAPAGAVAAVVNITAVSSGPGYLTAWASGQSRPTASTLNLAAGRGVANRAYVPLAGGSFDLYSSVTSDVVVDLVGWFGAAGSRFHPVTPSRLLDTRTSGAPLNQVGVEPAATPVSGVAGVPADAAAVLLTMTGTGPTASTWLAGWPGGAAWPGTSDLNLLKGETRANLAALAPGAGGTAAWATGSGSSHLVVDLIGYFR